MPRAKPERNRERKKVLLFSNLSNCNNSECSSDLQGQFDFWPALLFYGAIHKWCHPLRGEGDLPKGDVTP